MKNLFRKGDWNGFWALFADNLANMVISAGILIGVFKFPEEIVFGKVLPGIGMTLLFGTGLYAYLAYKLKSTSKRNDVTALPYGISTPVMFIYLFAVMGPVYFKTQNPIIAYQAGIGTAFIGGIIEALGSILGPVLRKITPRAGMLGTLAGIAITWIAAVPMGIIFEHPLIGLPALFIIIFGLIGGFRLLLGVPAGLAAIILGTCIGLITGDAKISVESVRITIPFFYINDVIEGIKIIFQNPAIFAVIIPIEIYNFIETMNNVESAAAAGDEYPTATCQIMDGIGTCFGAVCGCPFPTTVYIGHPAYKRLGAGTMYAFGVGIFFFLSSVFGIVSIFRSLIPEAAVAPLLVFVGVVITHQAFKSIPQGHGIAAAFALIPHIADLLSKQLINAVAIFEGPGWLITKPELVAKLTNENGIHISGYTALSQGAIISGLIYGAIAAYIIDAKLEKAALFAFAAFILTSLGIIHSNTVQINFSSTSAGYLIFTIFLAVCHFMKVKRDDSIGEL